MTEKPRHQTVAVIVCHDCSASVESYDAFLHGLGPMVMRTWTDRLGEVTETKPRDGLIWLCPTCKGARTRAE